MPGTTDNFVSNEIIVVGLGARAVQAQLNDTTRWSAYCNNVTDIRFHDGSGPLLSMDARFRFTIFGFPIEVRITEYVPPVDGQVAYCLSHTSPSP